MNSGPEKEMPHNDQRCVWMTAGILSYQLCDRDFECDHCPLDAAMRMHFSQRRQPEVKEPAGKELLRRLSYSRNHCWIEAFPGERGRVGLEPGFVAVLRAPKAIVLPAVGEKIIHNAWCAWLVLDEGTIPLRAPVSGCITAVHTALAEHPDRIAASPVTEGWLFEVAMKSDERVRSHLLDCDEAEHKFAVDTVRFHKRILAALNEPSALLGATMPDGGEFAADARGMLGGKRWCEIVREIFHP